MSSLSIKMTSSLKTHPKINQLAALLETPTDGSPGLAVALGKQQSAALTRNISRSFVITSLIIIWNAANEFAQEGVFRNVDPSYLDLLADYPGFGAAMITVGWAAYDKKKRQITLLGLNDINQVGAVKKSPGAKRQKEYRERLKLKNQISSGITAVRDAPGGEEIYQRDRSRVTVYATDDERGQSGCWGAVVIDGKTFEVSCLSLRKKSSHSQGIRQGITIDASGITESVTDNVTTVAPDVTQGITQCVTPTVTLRDSGITKRVTGHATVDGNDVTRILVDSVLARVSGVTQAVTDPITMGTSDVTQGITDSVTVSHSCVTPGVTIGDLSVTRNAHGITRSENPSRVISSREHTRLSFLRSKILNSKPKKTHTAREETSEPVDNSQPRPTRCQPRRNWRHGFTTNPQRKRAGYKNHPLSGRRFSAMLNVTQSLTLLRQGSESVCLTRKQANPDRPQQPVRSRTIQDIFPMFPAWKPSADFLETVGKLDIALAAEPDDAELREFIGYWSAGHAQHTQQQWELKLGRCLAEGRRRGRKRYEAKRDITIMPSADYEIPEGFRGG